MIMMFCLEKFWDHIEGSTKISGPHFLHLGKNPLWQHVVITWQSFGQTLHDSGALRLGEFGLDKSWR